MVADLQEAHLNRDERNVAVEQADDVEEPGRDLFGHDHGAMVVLRIALALDVPVLDRADNVGFVSGAQLDLNLVAGLGLWIGEQVDP